MNGKQATKPAIEKPRPVIELTALEARGLAHFISERLDAIEAARTQPGSDGAERLAVLQVYRTELEAVREKLKTGYNV